MSPTLLPPELEEFVKTLVTVGEFADVDAVVVEAVRRMREANEHRTWVRERITEAYESVEREGWIDLDDEAWDKYFADLERQVENAAPANCE